MFNINNVILNKVELIQYVNKQCKIQVAFACDSKYIKHIGNAIFSLLEHNNDIHIHIFTNHIEEKYIHLLQDFQHKQHNITLYYLNNQIFNHLQICGHFSTAMYYRLVIPYVLSHLDKVLYLDIDTLCLGEISTLFDINLTEESVAAVHDPIDLSYLENLYLLGFPKLGIYFNSGVLLFNIKKWLEQNIIDRFMELIAKGTFSYPDQDVLNIILSGKVRLLPEQYNWLKWNTEHQKLETNKNDIRFVHFVGEIKPWSEAGYNKTYYNYYMRSPWRNEPFSLPETTRQFRKFAKRLWRMGQKKKAIKYQLIYFYRKLFRK